jgi:HD-GYP domain-containing protein (c-di-GMP phosphodiesterase class II)
MAHILIWGKASEILTGRVTTGPTEEVHTLGALQAALDGKGAALVLVDVDRLAAEQQAVEEWWEDGGGKSQVVFVAVSDARDSDDILQRFSFLDDVISRPVTPGRLKRKVERALDAIRNRRVMGQLEVTLMRRGDELSELNKIGVALSAEREIDTLLELVLDKSRWVTGADAGSLYIREPGPENGEAEAAHLRFRLAQNDSLDFPFEKTSRLIDKSWIAGYVAHTGKPVRIDNAYNIPADAPYRVSRSFDQKSGYRTKSLLVVPMKNHKDEVIGVVQLINKKRDPATVLKPLAMMEKMVEEEVISFTTADEELASSLASQAAVAFQNAKLLQDIKDLFESFVKAAAYAIEQRDETTKGHSERVAILTVGLAQQVEKVSRGPLAEFSPNTDEMRELEWAALLHDFGKVGVREKVLLKEKKLLGSQLTAIQHRFTYIKKSLEADHLRRKLEMLESGSASAAELAALDAEYARRHAELDRILEIVEQANKPSVVVDEQHLRALSALRRRELGMDGEHEQQLSLDDWAQGPYLSARELDALSIPKGSLTRSEREEIENHVEETYEFLSRIPWTGEFRRIPEIARAHHEKLDGSGYPRKLEGKESIPVQSRMMTVSDVYDALVAQDRPYKPPVSPERAFDILKVDMKGQLDEDLLDIFIEARVWDDPEFKKRIQMKRRR